MSNIYYPLVEVDNKKKILFSFPQVIDNTNYLEYTKIKKQLIFGCKGLSTYDSINLLLRKGKFDKFIDFMKINCGCCPQCLRQRSLDIVFRLYFESKKYENNYFITLTFDDDKFGDSFNVSKKDISDFNKKLKVYLNRKGCRSDFKFFSVGEYGSSSGRKHYHSIMLNLDLPDLKFYNVRNGKATYTSELLNKVWNKGFVYIGSVEVSSICYVARYCDKKRLLSKCEKEDLKALGIEPEFQLSSKNLGVNFLEDYQEALLNNERSYYFINGQKFSIPRYYRERLKRLGYEFKENDNKDLMFLYDINNIYENSKFYEYDKYFTDMIENQKRKRGVL